MMKLFRVMPLLMIWALLVVGCSNDQGGITSPVTTDRLMTSSAKVTLPSDANLVSAKLYYFVGTANNQLVNVHRVTADWNELTVSWNSFAASYAPMVYGSFVNNHEGWDSVDVTLLVSEWLDGVYPNYGLLLKQATYSGDFGQYYSNESGHRPYLKVCYDGTSGACVDDYPLGDAYIWELMPDDNFGTINVLFTGWFGNPLKEKQSLLRFEFEVTPPPPPQGCTHTIGYWKTHAGFGPQADVVTQYLPISLGTSGGAKSINVTTNLIVVRILNLSDAYYGPGSNGISKLYAQLLGAKLSIADGADGSPVASVIAAADAYLATHNYLDWDGLSNAQKAMVLLWKTSLDNYNNGLSGVLHCGDADGPIGTY